MINRPEQAKQSETSSRDSHSNLLLSFPLGGIRRSSCLPTSHGALSFKGLLTGSDNAGAK